jgi:hypothetical protein
MASEGLTRARPSERQTRRDASKRTRISRREREEILRSLGIDPEKEKEKYQREKALEESTTERNYHCAKCGHLLLLGSERKGAFDLSGSRKPTKSGRLAGAYLKGELVCIECAQAGTVDTRKKESDRQKRAAVEASTVEVDPQQVAIKATGYGVLILVGIAAPLWVLLGLKLVFALAVAIAISSFGAGRFYRETLSSSHS